jgi:transcriptional regulator with XRE-family HTH domain
MVGTEVNTVKWSERLKRQMDDRRLTPEDVAKRSGITVHSVYAYLNGKVAQPRGDAVKRLAAVVGMTEQSLRYGDEANGVDSVAVIDGVSIPIDYKTKMELYESALRFIVALPSSPDDRLSTKMRMIAAAALDEPIMPPAPVAR